MKIRYKKLNPNAQAPYRAHESDAGFDLYATEISKEGNKLVYKTGIAVEIPKGYVGFLFQRSSAAKKDLILSNCVGVIDSGYRGELIFKFAQFGNQIYAVGDRIGQLVIVPIPDVEYVEVEELDDSDRGTDGYGSSGK